MNVLKGFLILFWTGASLLFVYYFWNGTIPERITGTASPCGIQPRFEITGARGWASVYKTTVFLKPVSGETFVYYIGELGSRSAVNNMIETMQWEESGDVLTFENRLAEKAVRISYRDRMWNLSEMPLSEEDK